MNKYLFLLFLFLGGGFVSCIQTSKDVDLLERVERYVEVYPDSAMQFLNLIPCPEQLHGKESADYALLLTQTLDKNNFG